MNRGSNRRNNNNQTALTNPVGYEGECERVDAILALRVEKYNKKASFEQLMEKNCNYVVKENTDGGDIKPLLMEGKDPIKIFTSKHMPTPLDNDS
jgi:hypothetical protein